MSNSCAVDPRPARSNDTSESQDSELQDKDQIEPSNQIEDDPSGPARRRPAERKD